MDGKRLFGWARNAFACIGVLGTLLVAVMFLMAYQQYNASADDQMREAPAPSLQTAQVLISQAGIMPGDGKRMRGGSNPPWGGETHIEAYCIEAIGAPAAEGWGSPRALDPLLAQAASASIDAAHAQLPCFPTAMAVDDQGLKMKLISADFEGAEVQNVRVAVRDPATGLYFLVNAWRPGRTQASLSQPSRALCSG